MKEWSTDPRISRDTRYGWLTRLIARIFGA